MSLHVVVSNGPWQLIMAHSAMSSYFGGDSYIPYENIVLVLEPTCARPTFAGEIERVADGMFPGSKQVWHLPFHNLDQKTEAVVNFVRESSHASTIWAHSPGVVVFQLLSVCCRSAERHWYEDGLSSYFGLWQPPADSASLIDKCFKRLRRQVYQRVGSRLAYCRAVKSELDCCPLTAHQVWGSIGGGERLSIDRWPNFKEVPEKSLKDSLRRYRAVFDGPSCGFSSLDVVVLGDNLVPNLKHVNIDGYVSSLTDSVLAISESFSKVWYKPHPRASQFFNSALVAHWTRCGMNVDIVETQDPLECILLDSVEVPAVASSLSSSLFYCRRLFCSEVIWHKPPVAAETLGSGLSLVSEACRVFVENTSRSVDATAHGSRNGAAGV